MKVFMNHSLLCTLKAADWGIHHIFTYLILAVDGGILTPNISCDGELNLVNLVNIFSRKLLDSLQLLLLFIVRLLAMI